MELLNIEIKRGLLKIIYYFYETHLNPGKQETFRL